MKKNIIIGNWKMNLDLDGARELVVEMRAGLDPKTLESLDVILCPTFIHIPSIAYLIPKNTHIGAQNCFWEDLGAFTGEVSASQLKDIGCLYVILGHSERRMYLGENYINVNKKIASCLNEGLKPIVCFGESLEERRQKLTSSIIETQIKKAFMGIEEKNFKDIVIAYEPIWAIGTGKTADSKDAESVARLIKRVIAKNISKKAADQVRVIYGGSVDHKNISSFIAEKNINGALVGSASTKATRFVNIIKNSLK